ncbi:hypothetical protein DRO33_04525, partial [Candidatus Bathyarchaeota archaeon]
MIWLLLLRPEGMPSAEEVLRLSEKLRLAESRARLPSKDTVPPQLPFDILHYDLYLWVLPGQDSVAEARAKVVFQLIDPLDTLKLNFVGLAIDSVYLGGSPAGWERQDTGLAQRLAVDVSGVSPGEVETLTVWYRGRPSHPGGLISNGGLNILDTIVYTDDEPWGARYWFPLYDEPSEKATCEITLKVPAGWRAVANGVLLDADTSGASWWTWHWGTGHQIANYLIAFAASQYAVVKDTFVWEGDTLPLIHYVPPAESAAAEYDYSEIVDMLEAYSHYYGVYPFMDEKYSQVRAPLAGAMENQTNTFMGVEANCNFGDNWIYAHELSHHWWGDLVTCGTWPDIWLNEGFATFSEAVWWLWRDGPDAYQYWIDSVRMWIYLNYYHWPPITIHDPGEDLCLLFSIETYDKASCVLHSLRKITEYLTGNTSLFWEALRYYKERHAESWAITQDFIQDYESYTGLDLGWFFDEWLYKPFHPIYDVGWDQEAQGDSFKVLVTITQTQGHDYGIPTFKMPVPLLFKMASSETTVVVWDSLDYQEFGFLLPDSVVELVFDPENWIIDEHTVHMDTGEANPSEPVVKAFGPTVSKTVFWVEVALPEGKAELLLYSADGRLAAKAEGSGLLWVD